ncbi:MAG TPA: hypothetical protein VGB59_00275 [Allosphingosinicella sp.]|jgi:hypothetical protein
MASYYVNNRAQPNGDHEVHMASCSRFPSDYEFLGDFGGCTPAVERANLTHRPANGCRHCCPACHTG